jgi:hypothetical protein
MLLGNQKPAAVADTLLKLKTDWVFKASASAG